MPCPSGLPTPSGRRTRRAPRHHQLLPVRARVGQRHPTLTAPDLTEEGDTPVRLLPGVVPVRDSKVTDGPTLVLPAAAWSPFIAAVTAGELTA
ncbi:DUF397 domain-containing protein [Streptomyces sp. NPDC015345]|uniref:DUF397 domain-containing protein n=1 Tax=Streptomyces sp. NPDC015345 TaxID=3364953 RepID=UPI0036FB936A